MEQNSLFLLHIPKTGGTTIEHHIASWMCRDDIAVHIEGLTVMERDALGGKRFVSGHLFLADAQRLPYWSRFKRAVILREPYARLASALQMTSRFGQPGNGAQLATLPVPAQEAALRLAKLDVKDPSQLASFLESGTSWTRTAYTNRQTQFLGGAPDAIEEAIQNLQAFDIIGQTESLRSTVAEISGLFDKLPPEKEIHANAATSAEWAQAPRIDYTNAAIREVLSPLLHQDMKLYEHVTKRLLQGDAVLATAESASPTTMTSVKI